MRILILFAAIVLSATSCSIKKSNANSKSQTSTSSVEGSSIETAVIIDENTETKGIAAEYKWLQKHYPGYKKKSQSLLHKNGIPYDIITIKTANGKQKQIYFNISNFFGKY